MKNNTKKLLSLILVLVMLLSALSGCVYIPPVTPEPEPDDGEEYVPDDGEEVEFDSALEAYEFGENYFNEVAKFYETTQYGTATAMGIGTYVMTKRYKSDVSNNFLYETDTIGTVIMGIDPTFALKAYKELDDETISYARVDGTDVENGAHVDTNASVGGFRAGKSVFDGVEISTKSNWNEYKNEVGGNIPDTLTVYIINESTIKEVLSFEENSGGFKYVFKFSLTEAAVSDYKKQVALCSKQAYHRFNPMDSENGLVVEFCMDRFGRILRMNVEENYTVDTGSAKATVVNTSVEYFSYNSRPIIEFIDENGAFSGPTITAAALPSGDDSIENYQISFDAAGGEAIDPIAVYYNTEIGTLPVPEMDGYVFAGWFTNANGEGERYNEKTLFLQRENLILHAYWYLVDENGEGTFALINDGTEYLIVKGDETAAGEFTIPTEYNDKPITAVGVDSYRANLALEKLIVPSQITRIEAGAFYGCTGITEIVFEDESKLEHIGDEAFRGLNKLASPSLPSRLESIGAGAFRACNNAGFDGIFIPKSVQRIGNAAFNSCSNLKEITFERGSRLTTIGDEAFRGCTNSGLSSVSIPAGVTEIGSNAFNGTKISEVVFEGGSIIRIGASAFYSCSNLTSIAIPSSVVLIDESAFSMSGLTQIIFDGGSLETIGASAFSNTKLASVRIPASVSRIAKGAFANISTLNNVTFAAGSKLAVIEDQAFHNSPNISSIKIPSLVTSIGASAFTRAGTALTALSSLEFAYDSVLEQIGANAFDRAAGLRTITIPSTVKTIGDYAFAGCASLAEINIAEDSMLQSIGAFAFQNCSSDELTSFVVPQGVTHIGGAAFANTNITDLSLNSTAFKLSGGVIYSSDYKTVVASVPKLILSSTTIDNRATAIGNHAFYNATELSISSLPETVTEIGEYAFYGCISLTAMTLHNGIKTMGSYAFYGCSEIETFSLSNALTELNNYVLARCSKLESITIPDSVTRIGQNAFRETALTEITIPATVKTMEANAFMNCKSLTVVTLNEGLETIGNAAFGNCSELTSIELPSSLLTLGTAFSGCSKLAEVVVNRWEPTSENPITTLGGSSAFNNTSANLKIYVKSAALESYSEATNWKNQAAKMQAIIED